MEEIYRQSNMELLDGMTQYLEQQQQCYDPSYGLYPHEAKMIEG
jgi:hypothetical protein